MAGQKRTLKPAHCWRYRVFGSTHYAGNPVSLYALSAPAERQSLLFHASSSATMDNIYFWREPHDDRLHARAISRQGDIQICGHGLLALAHHQLAALETASLEIITPAFTHRCQKSAQGLSISLPAFAHRDQTQPLLQSLLLDAGIQPLRLLLCDNAVWVVQCTLADLNNFERSRFPWSQLEPLMPGALILSAAMPEGAYALRYFSPWYGKDEDNATGSAQCYLVPLWLTPGQTARVQQPGPAGTAVLQVTLEATFKATHETNLPTSVEDQRIILQGRVDAEL